MTTTEVVKYPSFDVVRLEVDPRYKAIQEKGLIKVQLPYGDPCWLATRYEDVKTVFGHPQMSRALGVTKNAPGMFPASPGLKDPSLMLNQDPPEHTRLRRLASPSFTVARVALLEPFIQGVVDELFHKMSAEGVGADFVEMYSNILPVRTLAHILGIPKDQAFEFKKCVDISSSLGSPAEERQAAQAKLLDFIKGLLAERRAERSDNLLGELVEARDAGDRLTEDELTLLALALWHGGFKTTLWQLGTTLYTLMTHPEHWQELLEKPDLLPAAMEELWRWIPSFKYGVPFCRSAAGRRKTSSTATAPWCAPASRSLANSPSATVTRASIPTPRSSTFIASIRRPTWPSPTGRTPASASIWRGCRSGSRFRPCSSVSRICSSPCRRKTSNSRRPASCAASRRCR
jgi:hypothetical protein